MNTALFGIRLGSLALELGPSLDVFAVPLCSEARCQREHGLAPGGQVGAVVLPAPESRYSGAGTVHVTYVPGIVWSGVSIAAAVEGRYRF